MYTPVDNVNYDHDIKIFIDNKVGKMKEESLLNNDGLMSKELTLEEVQNVISKLKCNTALGWDEITVEHVKFGGLELIKILRRLFNVISKYEYMPLYFKRGIIVPIPKGCKNQLF